MAEASPAAVEGVAPVAVVVADAGRDRQAALFRAHAITSERKDFIMDKIMASRSLEIEKSWRLK